jgi:hypothetical protein
VQRGRHLLLVSLGLICGGLALGLTSIAPPEAAAAALDENETDQSLDVNQVVGAFVASLEALRNKPLRIKSETVHSPRSNGVTIQQTLLMHRRNVRLDEDIARDGRTSLRSETSLVNDYYLMAIDDAKHSRFSLVSCLRTPGDRFHRVVSRLMGADYLGYPTVIWRGQSHDILHVLPTLRLTARRETLAGMDTVLLEGTSEAIGLRLWLAPSLNYSPTRIEWRPTVPEKLTDENVDRIPKYRFYACEFRQFQKLGGSYVPRTIRIHSMTVGCHVQEGKVIPSTPREGVWEATWSPETIEPPRTGDFKLTIPIPEETRVSMEDAPRFEPFEYVWRNGAAVPIIDPRQWK